MIHDDSKIFNGDWHSKYGTEANFIHNQSELVLDESHAHIFNKGDVSNRSFADDNLLKPFGSNNTL